MLVILEVQDILELSHLGLSGLGTPPALAAKAQPKNGAGSEERGERRSVD